ncbi:hypothetical protein GALL_538270 [mine drainage metagenome]|uniref:Uncharacterized protein n=1 Tax=mine drainage metagenome TaxID=410659 RepID=A0A1J5P0K9_9ZZZZ
MLVQVGVNKVAGHGDGPEEIEADALVWQGQRDDALRFQQGGGAFEEGDQVRKVFANMGCDDPIEAGQVRRIDDGVQRPVAPDVVHLFYLVDGAHAHGAILFNQVFPGGMVDDGGPPAIRLGNDRAVAGAQFDQAHRPVEMTTDQFGSVHDCRPI